MVDGSAHARVITLLRICLGLFMVPLFWSLGLQAYALANFAGLVALLLLLVGPPLTGGRIACAIVFSSWLIFRIWVLVRLVQALP